MSDASVYLASRSPRRQELLRQIGVAFDVLLLRNAPGRQRDVIEKAHDGEPPMHYIERIARTKAQVGWRRMEERLLPARPVLGADTEVVLDDEIYGKPESADAARAMLARLSGRRHDVITAVALRWQDDVDVAVRVASRCATHRRRNRSLRRDQRTTKQGGRVCDQGRAAVFMAHLEAVIPA